MESLLIHSELCSVTEQIILGNKTYKSMPMSSISFEKFYFSSKKKTMKNGLSQSDSRDYAAEKKLSAMD